MENKKQLQVGSMPIVSRLDHVDFVVPMNTAIREAYFKGTLLERVASLEQRLLQLSLALESSNTSTGTSGESSSSQESKSEMPTSSFPIFNCNLHQDHHKQELLALLDTAEFVGKSNKRERHRRVKRESAVQKKSNGDEKKCKGEKKRAGFKWPIFRLLGC